MFEIQKPTKRCELCTRKSLQLFKRIFGFRKWSICIKCNLILDRSLYSEKTCKENEQNIKDMQEFLEYYPVKGVN